MAILLRYDKLMGVRKYKYYFTKPKSEITKDVFHWLLVAGAVCVAGTSPYFGTNLFRTFKKQKKYSRRKVYDTFYSLKKRGFLKIEKRNHQVYISLTNLGKKKAGMFQIDELKIKKPKKWDGKWRIIIFDITQLKKTHRDSLRGKLKNLGFYQLQKSAWIYPFDCRAEIDLLRDFFGLRENEMRLIISSDIGEVEKLKKIFKLTK